MGDGPVKQYSGRLSWSNGTWGASLIGSHYSFEQHTDNSEPRFDTVGLSSQRFTKYVIERVTESYSGKIEYAPNDDHYLSLTHLVTEFEDFEERNWYVFTYANAGMMLRLGQRLPLDYGPPRIQPSLPGSGFFVPQDGFGWYLFAGVEGRAVARNIFLDGNTFRDSRSVDKEPLVGDLQFGIALTWRNVRLSYTHVLRTREFETQDEADNFGAFSLSVRF